LILDCGFAILDLLDSVAKKAMKVLHKKKKTLKKIPLPH
jgi:hypothetical protein